MFGHKVSIFPVHLTVNFELIILFSKADRATIGFIVEPGSIVLKVFY